MSTAPETVEGRRQRLHHQNEALYGRGRQSKRPTTKYDLDVLKEHNKSVYVLKTPSVGLSRLMKLTRAPRFIRDSTTDPSQLSWEDNLALKYYNSLFREFAIANLKHYKSGQIALRWRTEAEVLSGVAHLTCASMRCPHHTPLPERAAEFEEDPESEQPLVRAQLEEYEVPFGYVEDGERKECLVKVVLCEEDGRRLMIGRRRAKKESVGRELERREDGPERSKAEGERRNDESNRSERRSSSRPGESSSRRRSASPPRRRH